MKKLSILLILIIISVCFSACVNNKNSIEQETSSNNITEMGDELFSDLTETAIDEEILTTTTKQNIKETLPTKHNNEKPSVKETTIAVTENIKNEKKSQTYYSENPDNKYIVAVANKFSVNKENLVALVRRNSEQDGATIIEFKGNRDDNGQLIKTSSEVKAVYDMNDETGEIKKATGTMSGNVGYSYMESLAVFKLTEKFIIPNLEEMKEKTPYVE